MLNGDVFIKKKSICNDAVRKKTVFLQHGWDKGDFLNKIHLKIMQDKSFV